MSIPHTDLLVASSSRKEFQFQKETTKGHGRLEVREIWTSMQMNEWFQKEWAGIAQVFRYAEP